MKLRDYQLAAIDRLKTGCILNGGVGSGKSLTSLGYFYITQGGSRGFLKGGKYVRMKKLKDLYIITTAHKRDTLEWEKEMSHFLLSTDPETNLYKDQIVKVDSWNNIKKYANVKNSFFIFDEQRVVGYGEWSKTFIKISKSNDWILLTATAGDSWIDYIPVFIANGFYKNKTEFEYEHVVYNPHVKYKQVRRYLNTARLTKYRNSIMVNMDFKRQTVAHHKDVYCPYDIQLYKSTGKNRWNAYENKPIRNAAELCYIWRKICNSDASRQGKLLEIFKQHRKLIVFYNFDYELDILRNLDYGKKTKVAEWNGHKHDPLPDGTRWVYLVQYTAGAEGWNCTKTNCTVFYSQSYSYKTTVQAAGRIDRLNTPFKDLYYYHLKSKSSIDLAIGRALKNKKKFNEGKFVKWQ